jgi:hypothetical protein
MRISQYFSQLGEMSLHGKKKGYSRTFDLGQGLEVDKMKIEVIEKLPTSTNIKDVRSFLRHASFYRRFIFYFSKITKSLINLLVKNKPFIFYDVCLDVFNRFKKVIISVPIL